jgi:thioesterase domain-containing protein
LQCQGISVEAVFLFDETMKMPDWERFKRHLRNSFRPNYLWGEVQRRLQSEREELAARGALATPKASLDLSNPVTDWDIHHRIWQYALWRHARGPYKPRQLASRGFLFRAQESDYNEIHDYDGCLGWGRLFAGGLEIVEVPGSHGSMWKEPNIRALSRSWDACLETLRRTSGASSASWCFQLSAASFQMIKVWTETGLF